MEIQILAAALLLLSLALALVGIAGVFDRLPRNRWVGLRSPALRANDEAWRAGHHAAGGLLMAAAGPPLLLAVALLVRPPDKVEDWLLFYIVIGVVTGGILALAVRHAERAAAALDA